MGVGGVADGVLVGVGGVADGALVGVGSAHQRQHCHEGGNRLPRAIEKNTHGMHIHALSHYAIL